jgi:ribose transport system ATP-binding protein
MEPRTARAFVDHFDPNVIVGHMTDGQQQLVEICKSLVREPRLLVVDEPTSSLSEADAKILFRVIADS